MQLISKYIYIIKFLPKLVTKYAVFAITTKQEISLYIILQINYIHEYCKAILLQIIKSDYS